MSVFPRFFLFYHVLGWLVAMGVHNHNEKTFYKKIVSKGFYKINRQNCFFLVYLSNTTKNIKNIYLTLVPFWPLTHQPTHERVRFLFVSSP